jgi:hypothetical protein
MQAHKKSKKKAQELPGLEASGVFLTWLTVLIGRMKITL